MEGKALIKARILKKRRTPPDRFSFLFEMGYLKGHVAEEDQSLRKITVSDWMHHQSEQIKCVILADAVKNCSPSYTRQS